ncbi:hypothetical protein PGT21_012405 [Puccinia graminis f. sp. tritici]|uniref:Uncharacterized protein n=2 Tax=Puccinia graminis f. sp. tritici TaxID=56615 RepID=A0A5B0M507_PUCGR|nr:hypothetical protein PGT21_012405 [Puccinia graminis f. sp. tritici]
MINHTFTHQPTNPVNGATKKSTSKHRRMGMDFGGSDRRPFEEIWIRLEGLPTDASYPRLGSFIERLRADPTVDLPGRPSLVDLVRPASFSQWGVRAIIRLVRPAELDDQEAWIARLLEAVGRLKLAGLSSVCRGPAGSLTPVEPVLLAPPSHPPSPSLLQPLPLDTPVTFEALFTIKNKNNKTSSKTRRRHPKRQRTLAPADQIQHATQSLAKLKTRESDFLAAKSLLEERSNRLSPFQKFVKNIVVTSSSNLSA